MAPVSSHLGPSLGVRCPGYWRIWVSAASHRHSGWVAASAGSRARDRDRRRCRHRSPLGGGCAPCGSPAHGDRHCRVPCPCPHDQRHPHRSRRPRCRCCWTRSRPRTMTIRRCSRPRRASGGRCSTPCCSCGPGPRCQRHPRPTARAARAPRAPRAAGGSPAAALSPLCSGPPLTPRRYCY